MDVKVTSFCFTNPCGGTGLSNAAHKVPYPHATATVKIHRGFFDYECGWRFVGESADPELTVYLAANGSADDRRIFVSEFELADRRDLGPLIDFVRQMPNGGHVAG